MASGIKITIAALCMAGVCWAGQNTLLASWAEHGVLMRAILLGCVVSVAAVVYLGVSLLLKNEEMEDFAGGLKRKLGRGKKAA